MDRRERQQHVEQRACQRAPSARNSREAPQYQGPASMPSWLLTIPVATWAPSSAMSNRIIQPPGGVWPAARARPPIQSRR
jgi:hypothetical protein